MITLNIDEFRDFRHRRHEDEYMLIDVRQPVEYTTGHIPGAVLMPIREFEERLETLPDKELVFYCRNGARSKAAALAADAFSETDRQTYNLEGGMLAWEGREVTGPPRLAQFNTDMPVVSVLKRAMNFEKGAFRFYDHVLKHYPHADLDMVITDLRDAEADHARMVHRALIDMDPEIQPFEPLYNALDGDILEGGIRLSAYLAELDQMGEPAPLDLLSHAVSLEYYAFDLYRFAAEKAGDMELRALLVNLSQAEKQHMQRLTDAIDQLAGG